MGSSWRQQRMGNKEMKLTSDLHVVGGGFLGFGISGYFDCHVYVLNSGSELALIDPGMGMSKDFDTILENIRADGLDPARIRKMILSHYHTDHIGAAAEAQQRLDVEVYSSAFAAPAIRNGDEKAAALDIAKAAGFFPADFHLAPCPVDVELVEGDVIRVGNLELETYETPGHCDGHLSFLMRGGERTYLLGADLVFWGGKVVWQNIHDCRIDAYSETMAKMEKVEFDALIPGHLQISLSGGKAAPGHRGQRLQATHRPAQRLLDGGLRAARPVVVCEGSTIIAPLELGPGIGQAVSQRPGIVGIEHQLLSTGNPGAASYAGHDRRTPGNIGDRLDLAVKTRIDDRAADEMIAQAHFAARMKHRQTR